MKKQKRIKRGRPNSPKGRGKVMSFYASPDTEEALRARSEAENKPMSVIIAEAISGGQNG